MNFQGQSPGLCTESGSQMEFGRRNAISCNGKERIPKRTRSSYN